MHKSYNNTIMIQMILFDINLLILSYIFSYWLLSSTGMLNSIVDYLWIAIICIPTWLFVMGFLSMYNLTSFYYVDRTMKKVFFATLFSAALIISIRYFTKKYSLDLEFILLFLVLNFIFVFCERCLYKFFLEKSDLKMASRVLIVGKPETAEKFTYYIDKTHIKMNIIGYVSLSENSIHSNEYIGNINNLEDLIKEHCIDQVFFALPKDYVGEVEEYILLCEEMGITVSMILDMYDLRFSKFYLSSIGTFPVLTFHSVSLNKVQLFIKRVIDILGALVGIILSSIIWIPVFIAIKLESPGPAIFVQDRVGLNGRIFKIYKFRSMVDGAEKQTKQLSCQNEMDGGNLIFKIKNDPRVTKIGKFIRRTSIDELPQFINVLKGEMSLVGTRPPTTDQVNNYKNSHRRRISIKPGLTGLWQVSGRNNITDFEEIVKLDTYYIDKWSIWLDFKIILKTFLVVINRTGAF